MKDEHWKKLGWCFVIFSFSVVIGVLVPGGFAQRDHVFFKEEMEGTFQKSTNNSPRIERFLHQSKDLTNQLAVVKSQIWSLLTNNPPPVAAVITNTAAGQTNLALADLISLRSKLEQDIAKQKEVLVPFYTSQLSLLWLDTFFTLGMLAFVFNPKRVNHAQTGFSHRVWDGIKTLLLAVPLLLFYKWPSILRSYIFVYDPDRLVLYYNARVLKLGSWSHIWDYFMEFCYCVLMITIWRQWIEHDRKVKGAIETDSHHHPCNFERVLDPERSKEILAMFVQWIVASLLLGSSFIFDAFFYYGAIADSGDGRYRISALLELTVWGVAWLIISQPLIHAWKHWNELRSRAVQELSFIKSPVELETKLKLLEEAQPLSTAVIIAAQIGAVVSFVGTLVEQVFK
jgi:hypothetical protein